MPVGLGKIYFFSEYGYRFLLFNRVMHFTPLKWCIWFHRLVAFQVKVTLRSVAGIMHALRGHYQGIFRA